ncbi:MAG: hypothetical protein ACFE68_01075 [Candidatus Hodarchaeota archaeon]
MSKKVDVENLAKKAIKDKNLLSELLQGILSKKDEKREPSFKALLQISEEHPELIYSEWDYFAELLTSDNSFHKYMAIYLIASLTRVDKENKFEKIFDKYYDLLDYKSVIPPSHTAKNSGKIAKAKPNLQTKITNKLLSIDETHHKPERKDLIKGYAIEAFNEYFEEAENKKEILEFVKKQLKSKSPTTIKKAKEFLKKWEK